MRLKQNNRQRRRKKPVKTPEEKAEELEKLWKPRTDLGKLVKTGKIESLDAIWKQGKVIREVEIIDFFLRDLEERILKIGRGKRPFRWVQRMTDSGRKNTYFVIVTVGNKNGYVGLGQGRAKEFGGAITQAVRKAKLNMIKVERGCGSWSCGCKQGHSVLREIQGKSGSVVITLKPAPKGTGLCVNNISKDILELAGIEDLWSSTKGHTKTRANLASSTFEAMKNLGKVKMQESKRRQTKTNVHEVKKPK